jgi:hypothetical protein
MLTTKRVSKAQRLEVMGRTEEQQERDAEQDQNIRHVRNVCFVEELHLLFGGAHEQEAAGYEQERGHVLEAVGIRAVGLCSAAILEHEGNLDDARGACCHQSVSKDRVNHGRDGEMLRVCRHCPAGHEDDHGWDQVPLRPSVSCAAEPDSHQSRSPPDDAHGCVLQVVASPRLTPSVFGEGVDAAPHSDDERVEEFLASSRPFEPELSD